MRIIAVAVLAIFWAGFSGFGGPGFLAMAVAQDAENAPDYTAWEKVAQRAESAVADRRASNTAFEGLRTELATWRAEFLSAQDINKARIATLANQISALGPEPESAGTEPAELTLRRQELTAQLVALSAPGLRAQEAFSRADGLIGESDSIIRERQAARLFELKPSPLNPSLWPQAWRDIGDTLGAGRSEIVTAWASQVHTSLLRERLPVTLFYLVVAAVLILRGRSWMVRLTARARGTASGVRATLRGFLVSTGQVILPGLGIWALVRALFSTELLGFRAQIIVDGLIPIGLAFFVARWLMLRLLPLDPAQTGFLQLGPLQATQMRRFVAALGLVWGGDLLLSNLAQFDGYVQASRVVVQFPLGVVAGYLLLRTGRLLRQSAVTRAEPVSEPDFRIRAQDVIGRVLIAVGIAGPVLGAIGYHGAMNTLLYPTILSLGLLALVIIVSGVLRDSYALVVGFDDEKAREALVPVLLGLIVALLSLPGFALIWGARVSDLNELWARFSQGVTLGDARISLSDFVIFAVVFAVGYLVTRLVQSTLKNTVLPKTAIDPGGQAAIVSGLGYVGVFLAALIAISTAGIDLSSLAIVAGALSVGVGFGLQNIVSNFVSGIILLIERPITEGDWIEVGGHSGTVRDISVRSTRIETFNRTDVIVPNADLVSGTVTNYTRGNLIGRAVIGVGVAYGTDTKKVEKILTDIAQAHPLVTMTPPPGVHLIEFGADSLNFEIRAVLRDVNYILSVKSDINHEIVRRFAREGIEIPFAQRDVWLRNPESLRAAPKNEEADND